MPWQSGRGLLPRESSSFLLLKYLGVWACLKKPEIKQIFRHSSAGNSHPCTYQLRCPNINCILFQRMCVSLNNFTVTECRFYQKYCIAIATLLGLLHFDHVCCLLRLGFSIWLLLPDPLDPLGFPGVPGPGNATNTISVMSFVAWMKEKKSWLSKPPWHSSEENMTRHMTDS